jgi:hypothetical protein
MVNLNVDALSLDRFEPLGDFVVADLELILKGDSAAIILDGVKIVQKK